MGVTFAGCGLGTPIGPEPEATSFLGTPLLPATPDSLSAVEMNRQLADARALKAEHPDSVDGYIWVGRRLAYLGRYRDAVEEFTAGLDAFPDEPRLLRHRGHRYITLRRLDRAIQDLSRAAQLTDSLSDEVEPDGQPNSSGIPVGTLKTNIWYHLALAHYLSGDFGRAAEGFQTCFDLARNNDMRVAAADWLFMSLHRANRGERADSSIAFVTEDMEILENHAYHRRLLMYQGVLPPDSLFSLDSDPLTIATLGYGVGNWSLIRGDTTEARAVFEAILDTGYWPAFGYIAAEADLARLTGLAAQ